MNADLHTHTTASDGSLTPAELVRAAADLGISLLAITDHDTVAGIAEGARAAEEAGIRLLPGVELSADGPPGKGDILGLRIDPAHRPLTETLGRLSEARRLRNEKMVSRLQELGVSITMEDVLETAPRGANIGRPHFAQTLVAKGVVDDVPAAFEHYLADGATAYLPKTVLTPAEAIALIHDAGGLAFVAHPVFLKLRENETLRDRIVALKALGMDGVEVYYPAHSYALVDQLLSIASDLDMLVTGGSDFHGASKAEISLGRVVAGGSLPISLVPDVLH